MANSDFDLIVIGGGTAGIVAVDEALALGAESIALIDPEPQLGGECKWYACVPAKTLLTAARLRKTLACQAPLYGLENIQHRFNFQKLMQTQSGILNQDVQTYDDEPRVEHIHGEAKFTSSTELQIGERKISGKKFIIATGSEALIPDIPGLQETNFITYKEATRLEKLPASMIILGGGPVGVELAQVFQWFGVQVFLVTDDDRLLEHEEPEISKAIGEVLKTDGVKLYTGAKVRKAGKHGTDGSTLKLLQIEQEGNATLLEAEQILIATGMKPRYESLDPAAAGIEFDEKGIKVDEELRTNQPHIWAIGDVTGGYQFTSVADYHAVLAARNVVKGAHEKVNYCGLGWALFTSPDIGHAGLTEVEAREKHQHVETVQVSVHEVARYRLESDKVGFIKLVIDSYHNKILGGHLIAESADDIVHLLMLGIRQGLTVDQFLDMIYVFPAKSQLVQKALEKYQAQKAAKELAATRKS